MELLKLLIVDDEPIVLKGLLETYDWDKMGFEIVGSAQNGESALELIKEKQPHLVLTDICMKHMDGLTLIEKVKEFDDSILFIMISAYTEFEYAQKACEIGAFSYLLKPIDEEKLFNTMKAVYNYCINAINSKKVYDNYKKILIDDSDNFIEVMVEKYLKDSVDEEKIKEVFKMLNKNVNDNNTFVSICVDIDISCQITNQIAFQVDRYNLFQYLKQVFDNKCNYWTFETDEKNIIFILDIGSNKDVTVDNIKSIMEIAKSKLNSDIISAISKEYTGFEGIKKSYIQARQLFSVASQMGASAFTASKEIAEHTSNIYPNDIEVLILNSIRKNDIKSLEKSLGIFINSFKESKNVRRYVHKLLLSVELLLESTYGLVEDINESFHYFYSNLNNISDSKLIDVCYQLFCKIIDVRKKCMENDEIEYFSKYISLAVAYIEENLEDEELSIASVAASIYLNPVYFGRVFKKVMKMPFKQYVLKRRMEMAKRLILDEKLTITDVSIKVGIPNSSYFSHLFKQYTGTIPSEYKRECRL